MIFPPVSCKGFVGRESELEFLTATYRDLLGGKGGLTFITGEAGIGKSRLIDELRKRLSTESLWFVKGTCLEYLRSPYLPLLEILRALYRMRDKHQRAKLLPESLSWIDSEGPNKSLGPLHDEAEGIKLNRFQAIASALLDLGKVRPIIALVEDLHWGDVGTGELLQYLVPRLEPARVLFLVTYRSEAVNQWNPLLPSVAILERMGTNRLQIAPFSTNEMRVFLQRSLDGYRPLPMEALRRIEEVAEGNPYCAEELLRSALQRHASSHHDRFDFPPSLKATIFERLQQLSELNRRVLEQAAVIGRRFEPDFLSSIVRESLSTVVNALRHARELQLIIEEDTSPVTYAFRHERTRAAIYDELLAIETLELHARIAAALEERPNRTDAAELAYHWAAAGKADKAIYYNERAAQEAVILYAYGDVARFLRRALDFAVEPGERRASLCEQLANALYISGDSAESLVWFEKAVDLYELLGNREKVVQMLLRVARQRCWLDVHTMESLQLAKRALAEAEALDDDQRFYALTIVARFCAMLSLTEEAAEHLQAAYELRDGASSAHIASYHDVLAVVQGNAGRIDLAIKSFSVATRASEESKDADSRILGWNNYGYLASWLGQAEVARHCYQRALRIAEESGYVMRAAFVALGFARTLMRIGQLAEAKSHVDRAISSGACAPIIELLLAEVGIPLGLMLDDSNLLSHCVRNHVLALALQSGESERIGPVACAFADLAEVQGDCDSAKEILSSALRALRSADQSWWMLSRCASLCDKDEASLAHSLLLKASMIPQHAAAQACLHLADSYLMARSGKSGAVAAAVKSAVLFKQLRWALYEARALETAGHTEEALQLFQEIGSLLDVRRLNPTASKASRGRRGTTLTAREEQVSQLVSQGKTNREIAEQLGISEHTVVHHIESAFNRLGIRSRAKLTAIIVSNSHAHS